MVVNNVSSSTAANTSAGASNPGQDINNTFLSLLIAELKTQDPTSPMDASQMVGQMVSLNQLNELIGIRQWLENPPATTSQPTNGAH